MYDVNPATCVGNNYYGCGIAPADVFAINLIIKVES